MTAVNITPLNARDLLESALLLDGEEPSEHVEALRAQFRSQVMRGYADRAVERSIRNPRQPPAIAGPAVTPKKLRGPAVKRLALPEESDSNVLHAFDRISEGIAKAIAHNRPSPQLYKNMEAVTAELRRRTALELAVDSSRSSPEKSSAIL